MENRLGNVHATLAAAALAALMSFGLSGCGALTGGGKKPAQASGAHAGAQSVTVDDGGEIADLAKMVKTKEDQLILDLMMGYRMLLLRNPDAKSLDKATLQRSRDAYDRLEAILRHGGVKAQDGGERVFTITNEDKLSLQEVIRSASLAADKAAREGDWEKARARWKEITQSKAAVAFTMEEAQWGLTFSDALQSALPDSLKRRLKDVNDAYQADAGHEEIGRQVKVLLEVVPDVKLQRELKKLANRAWEKDKKAGRVSAQAQAETAAAGTVPPESPDSAKPAPQGTETASGVSPAGASPAGNASAAAGPEAAGIAAEADSLAGKGKYVAALKALEKAGDQAWVKDKKNQLGDRFCEDKRRSAANSFKDFKKASADSVKRVYLKRTAADLDSCLFYFPDLPVAQKVRKNREMVEGELKRIKP